MALNSNPGSMLARALAAYNQSTAAVKEYARLISAEPSVIASAAIFESAQLHLANAQEPQARQRARRPPSRADRGPQASSKRLVLLYPLPPAFPAAGVAIWNEADIKTELATPDAATAELQGIARPLP